MGYWSPRSQFLVGEWRKLGLEKIGEKEEAKKELDLILLQTSMRNMYVCTYPILCDNNSSGDHNKGSQW